MNQGRNRRPSLVARTWLALATTMVIAAPASAQTDLGVTMDSWHVNVADVEAARDVFVAMGGTAVTRGGVQAVEIPGVTIYLHPTRPTGGTVGSVVEHLGIHVPNVDDAIARWQAAGVPIEHSGAQFPQAWIDTADGLRIEVLQNEQTEPVRHHHVHFYVPEDEIPDAQAWYAEVFGAVPGMRGRFQAVDIPGANLTFSPAAEDLVPTEGRALDRIGFTVPSLAAFCQHLQGRKDVQVAACPMGSGAAAHVEIVDPWGSTIVVTQEQ